MTIALHFGRTLIALLWLAGVTTYAQDAPVAGQDAPVEPQGIETADPVPIEVPLWTATLGGGLALASGNTHSLSYNLALDVAYGTKTGNMLRWTGLYLRGTQNDILTVNRLSLGVRNEYTFSPRGFTFARIDYLHDTFKRIDFFAAPAVGLGYKIVETPATRFSIDLGAGSVTERNLGNTPKTTGAVQATETLQHQLNSSASIKHTITTVWNTDTSGSALFTGSLGLATRISSRFQLSVDLLDTYKTRPPTTTTERNDINVVVAITAKY
jgi:putative salt-induced outer membrane protein YdiY